MDAVVSLLLHTVDDKIGKSTTIEFGGGGDGTLLLLVVYHGSLHILQIDNA